MNEEQQIYLEEIQQRLPASLREPLVLHTIHGLSYSEIAVRMGLSEAAVRKRVQLARNRLRVQQ